MTRTMLSQCLGCIGWKATIHCSTTAPVRSSTFTPATYPRHEHVAGLAQDLICLSLGDHPGGNRLIDCLGVGSFHAGLESSIIG
jgi:hypothetical protein